MKRFTNGSLKLFRSIFLLGFVLSFTATSRGAINRTGNAITADPEPKSAASDLFNEFEPRFWENRDGLPFNQVSAIHVDSKGYLWLGSYFGITRFNGEEFVKFDPYNTPTLRSDTFTGIVAADETSFWASTSDGLYLSGGKEFRAPEMAIPSEVIQWITRTDDGVLWMATDDGLVKYDGGRTAVYRQEELDSSSSKFQSIRPLGPNQLLVFGSGGSYLFDSVQERFMELPWGLDKIDLQTSRGPVLAYDSEGYVWYQSSGGGTFRFYAEGLPDARATNAISVVPASEARFSDHIILGMDKDKNIWISHQNGKVSRYLNGVEQNINLHNRYQVTQVDTFLQDGDNYWLGSEEGLVLLKRRSVDNLSLMEGLPDHHVSCIAQFPDGRFLIGTAYEPAIFDSETGELTVIHLNNLDDRNIRSVCVEPEGGFWISNEHHGPLLIDADYNVHYSPAHSIWHDTNAPPSIRVAAMTYDSSGSFWIGCSLGAIRIFPDDSFVVYNRESHPELPARFDVRVIYEHTDNSIWMGSEGGGLVVFKGGEFKLITMADGLSGNEVFALTLDPDSKTVWAATDNGVTRIRDSGATIHSIGHERNLPPGTINQILIDDNKDMWITSLRGVHRVSVDEMNTALNAGSDLEPLTTVDWSDGMLNAETNGESQPAGIIDNEGHIWIPTIKGATSFDPVQYRAPRELPPPLIERITLDKQLIFDNAKPGFNEANLTTQRTLGPAEGDRLEIELAAPSIRLTETATYQVRLSGDAGDRWEDTKAPRVIYTTLKPGKYAFQSRVASSKGNWSPPSVAFRFEREQYFYRTLEFYSFVILTAVGGGFFLHYRRMRVAARILHLEQSAALLAERERIARDVHDDLGSRLTHISLIAEISERENNPPTREQISELNSAARHAARAMEEIVWGAKPENDTWDNTLSYLIQHAEHQLATADIACRNDFNLDWADKYLAPDIRSSVLLTFKEAINNIIKHSQATEVWVSVFPTENVVTIRIKDNGRGFDPENLSEGEHNGLLNMASRMADVGGSFTIRSKTDKGTVVEIAFAALRESDTHYSGN